MYLKYITLIFAIVWSSAFLATAALFLAEGSRRASLVAFLLGIILPVPLIFSALSGNFIFHSAGIIVTFVTISFCILLLLPVRGKKLSYTFNTGSIVDERDTIFSRKDLKSGTSLYEEYYSNHPDTGEKDIKWRKEPGILSKDSLFFNKLAFSAADASFDAVKLFIEKRDLTPDPDQYQVSSPEVTEFIREWSKKLGASDMGFTIMQDYHYYTVSGRGTRYGQQIKRSHKFGIVFLVEMDHEMISAAPRSPVIMESANQYFRSGAIATQVALMIRKLGYNARTHIDANYDIICPVVARDAGLGEIGRNGLLISRKFGPRVRISIVTTDLPVEIHEKSPDASVLNFCSACRKCAINCPVQSISSGPLENREGVVKWQVDHESCFTYWNHSGTDCGRCISTCPYAHRNNWFHSLIRKGIANNIIFLHLAIIMDNCFYGKRPLSVSPKSLVP
jgi:reductive dehalogenase